MEKQAAILNGEVLELTETVYVALLVLSGFYGNNETRIKKLKEDGYNPDIIQKCVNDLVEIRDRYK